MRSKDELCFCPYFNSVVTISSVKIPVAPFNGSRQIKIISRGCNCSEKCGHVPCKYSGAGSGDFDPKLQIVKLKK